MRVILDCDPGNGVPATDVDDGLALGLCLASPEVELEAVTVVSGNTHRDVGVRVARTLLDRVGARVPLYAGAANPLVEDPAPWRTELDGKRVTDQAHALWDAVDPPVAGATTDGDDAAGEIARRIAAAPGEVTLVAVGPLTNVAHALARRPEIATEVRRIVVMGGAFDVPDQLQELNFGYDPEAAHAVLTSGAPVTLVPLDVTRRTTFRPEDVEALAALGNPLATYLADTTRPWVRWVMPRRDADGCHLHDPLAVAALLEPALVTTQPSAVDVELRGTLTRARPIRWGRRAEGYGLRVPDLSPVDVVTEVDNDALVRLLLTTLSRWPLT